MASGSRAGILAHKAQPSGTQYARLRNSESVSKAITQYTQDARLHTVFESGKSDKSFDYSQSTRTTFQSAPEQQITTYLLKIQRDGHIQPFGCMIAIDESTFIVITYSENAREMLGITSHSVPSLAFYAILHRIDVRILINLEPARTEDPALSIAGAEACDISVGVESDVRQ